MNSPPCSPPRLSIAGLIPEPLPRRLATCATSTTSRRRAPNTPPSFEANEDFRNELVVKKDYAAPGKPG